MGALNQLLQQLKKQRDLKSKELDQLEEAIRSVSRITGAPVVRASGKGKKVSEAVRRKIAASQRARWDRVRAKKAAKASKAKTPAKV